MRSLLWSIWHSLDSLSPWGVVCGVVGLIALLQAFVVVMRKRRTTGDQPHRLGMHEARVELSHGKQKRRSEETSTKPVKDESPLERRRRESLENRLSGK